ncbi:STAS domain-containing protein [Amycolatopsis rhabdoformis]|uniref:Anti-sigma factor antagonist n=1 Tax=Amycolatopsis rhabdoformis TaxID=1448059 RepID=A0ABZ1IDG1_9PSEU|nr:STAS domain-containing protein [Amycolatopsis rhabdoformis]WSE31688.1 STAS domain-containing protein [Amycolatopsis rhabdoformis]
MAESGVPADDAGRVETAGGAVALRDHEGTCVLTVSGALDLALAPQLRRLVERAARTRAPVLVIDLSAVDFLASAGMAVLVWAHRLAEPADVRVVASGRLTLRPLELTRLTDELALFPSLPAALEGV